jgi:ubiquinone/menaquinone biosynthesis C-methylase UbiE
MRKIIGMAIASTDMVATTIYLDIGSLSLKKLITTYNLGPYSKILDVGCGKGFLLHEMLLLEPKIEVVGFDISNHGIAGATELIKPFLFVHQAQDNYPFTDKEFDLVISLGTLHNLRLFRYKGCIKRD